jgi:hypothetical protein
MNSEQTNEIAAALAKAQGQMENAKYNKTNPHFRNKYADLAAIIEAVKKPLADNGIAFSQVTDIREETFVLVTTLMHSSGQWIESEYPLPLAADKPQVMGSALTYARRYELATICGIAAEEDNDAEGVAEAVGARKPPKPAPDIIGSTAPGEPGNKPVIEHIPHDPKTGEVTDDGINVQDMAREAAQRGREVMKQFYKSRTKAERAEIDLIRPELDDLVDAAEATQEEGS